MTDAAANVPPTLNECGDLFEDVRGSKRPRDADAISISSCDSDPLVCNFRGGARKGGADGAAGDAAEDGADSEDEFCGFATLPAGVAPPPAGHRRATATKAPRAVEEVDLLTATSTGMDITFTNGNADGAATTAADNSAEKATAVASDPAKQKNSNAVDGEEASTSTVTCKYPAGSDVTVECDRRQVATIDSILATSGTIVVTKSPHGPVLDVGTVLAIKSTTVGASGGDVAANAENQHSHFISLGPIVTLFGPVLRCSYAVVIREQDTLDVVLRHLGVTRERITVGRKVATTAGDAKNDGTDANEDSDDEPSDVEHLKIAVFHVPDTANVIFDPKTHHVPGTDASFTQDDELPENARPDFSDDEDERQWKADRKARRLQARGSAAANAADDAGDEVISSSSDSEAEFDEEGNMLSYRAKKKTEKDQRAAPPPGRPQKAAGRPPYDARRSSNNQEPPAASSGFTSSFNQRQPQQQQPPSMVRHQPPQGTSVPTYQPQMIDPRLTHSTPQQQQQQHFMQQQSRPPIQSQPPQLAPPVSVGMATAPPQQNPLPTTATSVSSNPTPMAPRLDASTAAAPPGVSVGGRMAAAALHHQQQQQPSPVAVSYQQPPAAPRQTPVSQQAPQLQPPQSAAPAAKKLQPPTLPPHLR